MASSTEAMEDGRLAVKYELWDDMTDQYRRYAARIAAFQTLAEVVGALPFSEWVDRVPTFHRKQMLVAKIQDEVGHGHVMARVAEDLGLSREQVIEDFLDGKTKLLSIFHYGFDAWEEIGPAALLMNSAAIVQFQSLEQGTYLPYARALRKIEKEESFHYHHALDLTHEVLTTGTPEQRAIVQDAFEVWLPRMLAYFGPPDSDTVVDNTMYKLGLKVDSNDTLRQRWLAKIIPVFEQLGVEVPHDLVHLDEDRGEWVYATPDWAETNAMIQQGGPRAADWEAMLRDSFSRNAPYKQAALNADLVAV